VSVQITKGPLLRPVVPRRVHSFTHSFPSRWIHRESTLPIGTPNKPLPYTMPNCTHIGSQLHCSNWWPLHEPVLRIEHDDYHRLLESNEYSSIPVTSNPYSPHKKGTKVIAYRVKNKVLVCYPNPDQIMRVYVISNKIT
jgi:hypothetical protein